MAAFLSIAVLLAAAVAALILRPVWRVARGFALCTGASMIAMTIGLYFLLGTPDALDARMREAPATTEDAIARLEATLAKDAESVEAWFALGRAHSERKDWAKARDAFRHAAQLAPRDADILVEAAKASALAHPQKVFEAEAIALLEAALRAEPGHQRARWFLGVAHRQAGDAAKAALLWESLLGQVDANTERSLRTQIASARSAAGLAPLAPKAAGPHALRIHVDVDKAAIAEYTAQPNAAVYIMARATNGGGMPFAVEKHALSELPFDATLDDDDGPMPTQRLSMLHDVDIIARVSPTGDPMARATDARSQALRVHLPHDEPIVLTIGKGAARVP